jgi:cytochrome c oxidase assembly protein subunit 11
MAAFHPVEHRNKRVGLYAALMALAMLGVGYAAVPLYRLFCQTTGFNGTPKRISEAEAAALKPTGQTISIRFDANTDRGMPWMFRPGQTTQTVPVGERRMAIFEARNDSNRPITGQASYNIEPEQAAPYFTKVQCFCFTQQTLAPHQQVSMPVIFYVDPKIAQDPNASDVGQITLSYTFHEVAGADVPGTIALRPTAAAAKPLDRPRTGG